MFRLVWFTHDFSKCTSLLHLSHFPRSIYRISISCLPSSCFPIGTHDCHSRCSTSTTGIPIKKHPNVPSSKMSQKNTTFLIQNKRSTFSSKKANFLLKTTSSTLPDLMACLCGCTSIGSAYYLQSSTTTLISILPNTHTYTQIAQKLPPPYKNNPPTC